VAATIFALSSGRPPAALSVVRVSGPGAGSALRMLAGTLPSPRRASLRTLRGVDGLPLDQSLVLWFPGPATATGEDLAELHLHGGRAVLAAVEAALGALPELRAAEAGEFTRRALENGVLDLSQAEGLADLLAAETEDARRAALATAEGAVGRMAGDWADRLVMLSAEVEAALDFSDEADVGESDAASVVARAGVLRDEMRDVLARPAAERLRDGIRVVLSGPPNAGKSTLLNLMCGRDAAIVSAISGTTRDVVEVPVQRGGRAYLLQDTAGLSERQDDPVEAIGVERARTAASVADVVLWLGDACPPRGAIWLHPRADERRERPPGATIAVGRDDPESVEQVWQAIEAIADGLMPRSDVVLLGARQRALVGEAAAALADLDTDLLVLAEQLRIARRRLLAITGADATEAVLDALFGRFCIGK
jgi:tRNA modification GTPase